MTVDDPLARAKGLTTQENYLERSLVGLRRAAPDMSAHTVLSVRQRVGLVAAVAAVVCALLGNLLLTAQVLVALITLFYGLALGYRLLLVRRGMRDENTVHVTDEEALAVADVDLPVYTVLVPAYREPEVIGKVIAAIGALDYPADRHRRRSPAPGRSQKLPRLQGGAVALGLLALTLGSVAMTKVPF